VAQHEQVIEELGEVIKCFAREVTQHWWGNAVGSWGRLKF
jgi:hypothetical protein